MNLQIRANNERVYNQMFCVQQEGTTTMFARYLDNRTLSKSWSLKSNIFIELILETAVREAFLSWFLLTPFLIIKIKDSDRNFSVSLHK